MPMVTPSLNLPQPSTSSSAAARTPAAAPLPSPALPSVPMAKMPDAPSTTVTLSPQAMSALASSGHPPVSTSSTTEPAVHDGSVYESLKNGISTAVTDVGDAIAGGAHAVVDGVETALSTANKIATGILELPFAVVAKASDAVGALVDEL